jgi:hypothetical protein
MQQRYNSSVACICRSYEGLAADADRKSDAPHQWNTGAGVADRALRLYHVHIVGRPDRYSQVSAGTCLAGVATLDTLRRAAASPLRIVRPSF